MSLEALGRIYNFGADADDKFYHNTRLLLKLLECLHFIRQFS